MSLDRNLVVAALPSYELGQELGRGGWGVVLQARHRQLGREVAIKQLPRAFAADPAVHARFVAEARLLAGFDHPHIVPVYDFVEAGGLCLLVMEKLPGGTVWSRFLAEGVSMARACAIALATCSALECAHAKGVLHRDIKPENLLFSGDEVVKVTDFGIAKVVGGSRTLATRAGEVLGTPAYMAPEQAQAGELSPATDVYATGTMLYELLAGRLPFPDDGDALAVVYRHVYDQPAPLADVAPDVPGAIGDVVMRSIATDPADRFESAEAFGLALAEAATSAWGPGWLGHGELKVTASPAVAAVTQGAVGRAPVPEPTVPTAVRPPEPGPAGRVRPSAVVRRTGGRLDDVDAGDLVPVNDVLRRPPAPTALVLAALALVAATLVLAFAGLGSADQEPPPPGVGLMVNGAVVTSDPVEVDLSLPLVVSGKLAGAPSSTIEVDLRFSLAGVPLGSASSTAETDGDGSFTASVDASRSRYLVAGRATATLVLSDAAGSELSRLRFPMFSRGSALLTAPGVAEVVLVVMVVAYAESVLRARRKGHARVTAAPSMVAVGALGGVAAAAAGWLFAGQEPAAPTVVGCAALGAGAGLAAVAAAGRSARRRRYGPRTAT